MSSADIARSMLSERSGFMDVTADRVELLRGCADGASPKDKEVILAMLGESDGGAGVWPCTVERCSMLFRISSKKNKPSSHEIQSAIDTISSGATDDSVYDKPWVTEALSVLGRLT